MLFKDIESGEIVTLEQLEKEFNMLRNWDPASYDYNLNAFIENSLTRNNGTLEEIKQGKKENETV